MPKRFLTILAIFLTYSTLFSSTPSEARVAGVCSNCHVMHNSQNDEVADENGPQPYLLNTKSSDFTDACVACHTNTTNTSTIVEVDARTRIPIVLNIQEPTYPSDGSSTGTLAGGNFHWLYANDGVGGENQSVYGHNVLSIDGVPADENLSEAPGKPDSATGAMCAGCHDRIDSCTSCHDPAHHANDTASPVVGKEGGWYRFLNSPFHGSDRTGVIGIEDDDWEQTVGASDHNEYMGTNNPYGNNDNSMSNYCAGCHYKFHGLNYVDTDGVIIADNHSPWFRHPAHLPLPNDPNKEYYYYNNPGGTGPGSYNPIAPRDPDALVSMTEPSSIVTPGSDQVMCLSCHRPHGTPYPDMLRWNYLDNCVASSGASPSNCGCLVCHTTK